MSREKNEVVMRLLFNADRVAEDIDNNLQALSWSFTHFLLWRGYRLQFDCGEGAGMRLDDHIFRVDTLALSHGHYDHCAGLLGMLHVRNGLMGATDKPLRIVYPAEAAMMQHWISEAQRFVRGRQLDHVTFCPIEDGQSFELRKGHVLEARRVPHLPDEPCLAFRVGRQCTRRRPEYEHLTTQQV
ncbi:MAG: hypothetical protein JXN61_04110, partial [Sedimentisphaerales bacterium]|nr:hypothetical protein [Sedimentisphaerales bacterium]